jgi:hypothetical protein
MSYVKRNLQIKICITVILSVKLGPLIYEKNLGLGCVENKFRKNIFEPNRDKVADD